MLQNVTQYWHLKSKVFQLVNIKLAVTFSKKIWPLSLLLLCYKQTQNKNHFKMYLSPMLLKWNQRKNLAIIQTQAISYLSVCLSVSLYLCLFSVCLCLSPESHLLTTCFDQHFLSTFVIIIRVKNFQSIKEWGVDCCHHNLPTKYYRKDIFCCPKFHIIQI